MQSYPPQRWQLTLSNCKSNRAKKPLFLIEMWKCWDLMIALVLIDLEEGKLPLWGSWIFTSDLGRSNCIGKSALGWLLFKFYSNILRGLLLPSILLLIGFIQPSRTTSTYTQTFVSFLHATPSNLIRVWPLTECTPLSTVPAIRAIHRKPPNRLHNLRADAVFLPRL